MSQIQVEIMNTRTGAPRHVLAKAGDIVAVQKCEIVLDQYPVGPIEEGDPVLVLEQRRGGITAEESKNIIWDVKKAKI
jgi:hypothetical protein